MADKNRLDVLLFERGFTDSREKAKKLIKEGKFDATDIITHKLSLEKGSYAYDIFDNKMDNCIKVIMKP